MKKKFHYFSAFIERFGKRNVILILIILLVIVVANLYQTFSLYISSEGFSILNGIKTYKFIINNNSPENSITIAAGASKNIAITVSNEDKIKLKYGIYYSSNNDLANVDIGYKLDTDHLPNGSIEPNQNYIVTIQIDNNSSENITIYLGILYGLENGGDLPLASDRHFLEPKWNFPLAEVSAGSYVKYIGNNGCTGMSCYGQNANYISDEDMGYCGDSTYKYNYNGWRVAYTKNDQAYLISAGSPECMCTNSDGTTSDSSCSSYEVQTSDVVYHFTNLNNKSLNYCNSAFVNENDCSNYNSWNITETEYAVLTSNYFDTCVNLGEHPECGYQNSLIDIGSRYWFANSTKPNSSYFVYVWYPYFSTIGYSYIGRVNTQDLNGIRPIMKLDSTVIVTSGTGTYQDPYIIDNPSTIKDLSGNMNNGVNKNAVWNQKEGTFTTDGINSYANMGLVGYNFKDQVSLALRVKFNSIDQQIPEQDLLCNFESGGLGLAVSYGKLSFILFIEGIGYRGYYTTFIPEPNTWYNIVGVYNGTNISLYVNGVKMDLDTSISNSTASLSGNIKAVNIPFILNGNPLLDGRVGFIADAVYSDVLIFNRALTENEIATNYIDEINLTNRSNLLLYYDFKR